MIIEFHETISACILLYYSQTLCILSHFVYTSIRAFLMIRCKTLFLNISMFLQLENTMNGGAQQNLKIKIQPISKDV